MRLGQHFLINKEKIGKIVKTLDLKRGDVVVEIGPGHGELTSEIVSKFQSLKAGKFRIIAVEKDKGLAESLKKKFAKNKNIEIIEGDALKIIPRLTTDYGLQTTDYKLTGNIPYYITGYLLRILGELEKNKPSLIVLTIQKEVAERVCALRQGLRLSSAESPQGRPKMNLLAASVQFWAKPEIIEYVSKKDFKPAPKVDSAIVRLSPTQIYAYKYADSRRYYQFIKILFKQPRKTILNNVSKFQSIKVSKEGLTEKLREVGIEANARPQDLNIERIDLLYNNFRGEITEF